MRVKILTASLAVVVGCGALGCKSAPKMAWWSSSKDAKVESTAVAHAAPQLPSEVAKQAEGVNPVDPLQISTAPAFAATTNPVKSSVAEAALASAYPSTGAPSYVPTKSVATTTSPSSSAMPYNPNAVPAAKTTTPEQSMAATTNLNSSPAPDDRYGNRYTQNTEPAAALASASETSSYPDFSAPVNNLATSPAMPVSSNLGDRYATAAASVAPSKTIEPSEPQQVQTASAIAASDPYRPGGTGTYPSMGTANASYEVANRPAAPASSQSTVPNGEYPSTGAIQYR